MYKIFLFISKIYTFIIKWSFNSFGKGSVIKPFLNFSNPQFISIGNNVDIGSSSRITVSTEFGGVKVKSDTKVKMKIGDNVDIGSGSFISANNDIQIGDDVITSENVFITDHDHGFSDFSKNLREQPLTEGGFVHIGANVFIGYGAAILKNVSIGERSVIGANSVVTKDIPSYCIAAGNPAKIIKKYDFNLNKWIQYVE